MGKTVGLFIFTTVMATFGLTPIAEATPYGGTGSAQVSDNTPAPGQAVVVSGAGFAPNSPVTVVLEPGSVTLATLTANATGAVTGTVTIPAGPTGNAKLVLKGVTAGGAAVSASLAIVVGSAGSGGGLPTTGSNTEPMVMWALAAAAAGGAMVLVVTRRRRDTIVATSVGDNVDHG